MNIVNSIRSFFGYVKTYSNYVDFSLLITYVLLGIISVTMVYSASMVPSIQGGLGGQFYLLRQLQFFIMGALILFFMSYFMSGAFFKNKQFQVIMIFSIMFIVVFTAFFGVEVNGERNWIDVPGIGMRIQPSEFFKIAVILYLSYIYNRKKHRIKEISVTNLAPVFFVSIISVIVLVNDLGTGTILFGIAFSIFIFSGIPLKFLLKVFGAMLIPVILFLTATYLIKGSILSEYQIQRIETFFHPFNDPLGSGYQITNSLISISHGGIFGQGLGNGIMKLGYLPEPHTDFIIAVIAEELGLVGIVFVLGLYAFLAFKAVNIAFRTNDMFYRLISIGIAVYISLQTFINVGGVSKLIPLTGVPMPLMSYGGSSFLSMSIAIGLLVIASKHTKAY